MESVTLRYDPMGNSPRCGTNVVLTLSDVYGPRTICLKFDQNWASNSLDITDMNKCPQDKG